MPFFMAVITSRVYMTTFISKVRCWADSHLKHFLHPKSLAVVLDLDFLLLYTTCTG